MNWVIFDRNCDLGFLPLLITDIDVPVAKQLEVTYAHGGGWRPQSGFTLDIESMTLKYPGDPPMRPLAMAILRNEMIFFYEQDYLCIVQQDHSFEVARVD
jgi:hypothetical protein